MKTITIFIICSLILFTGCNLQEDVNDAFTEIKLTEKAAQLIQAENQFGFELFQNVFASEKEYENIMLSPMSISLALAMTYNGADGETKSAMEKTLKVYGLSTDEINDSYLNLINSLKSLDKKVLLEIANAIFYHEDFLVKEDFISSNEYYYKAFVTPLNFQAPQKAVQTINGWVDEKTNGKIKSIIDQISPDHVMFLLNAIYFKGTWQKEFNEKETKAMPFTTGSGEVIQTETMHLTDTLPFTTNELFSAVQLRYGKGNYNMYVILPNTDRNLHDVMDNLNEENWNSWMNSFETTGSLELKLPRFRYEYEILLNDILSELGMEVAFTNNADFTGISDSRNLKIDFVKHKTFVEVNEEGTEAAAVTAVGMVLSSAGSFPQPFIVDRPFLFAITEKSTGAVIFIGTVNNPSLN